MRKIAAITGHMAGIGKGIADALSERGYEILGFSLENGTNLWDPAAIERVAAESAHADLFVNNAYAGPAQVQLLYAMVYAWKDNPAGKTILNIGSVSGDEIKNKLWRYGVWKTALDAAVNQIHLACPNLRIMTLRPGMVDTVFSAKLKGRRLSVERIVSIAMWMLDQPDDMLVRSVSVTPFPCYRGEHEGLNDFHDRN